MTYLNLQDLDNEELQKRAKTIMRTQLYDSLLFGFLLGISIYDAANNGFGLLTFLPLTYLPIAGRNLKSRQAMKQALRERGLV